MVPGPLAAPRAGRGLAVVLVTHDHALVSGRADVVPDRTASGPRTPATERRVGLIRS
ncbi:hypothetical protein ABZV34_10210 [Streptomyces sp. NPDC005195]|uniref:hypothetical protein n=1 Tax=Streptomyces sp. NPDC005195 TaxID=3154561 RepID=UPI0033A0D6EF